MSATSAGASPWTARQRLVLLVLVALGAAGLVSGYLGTSSTLRLSRAVVWLNVAGTALVVCGVGIVGFLTAGRRAIGRRRLTLFGDVGPDHDTAAASEGSPTDTVAAPTMTRYHRPGCSFVTGKTGVAAATVAQHERAGRRACGVCAPEAVS